MTLSESDSDRLRDERLDLDHQKTPNPVPACRNYLNQSGCGFGDKCPKRHNEEQLRAVQARRSTMPCKFFTRGSCAYGENCQYSHTHDATDKHGEIAKLQKLISAKKVAVFILIPLSFISGQRGGSPHPLRPFGLSEYLHNLAKAMVRRKMPWGRRPNQASPLAVGIIMDFLIFEIIYFFGVP